MASAFYASYAGGVNAAVASPRLMAENQLRQLVNGTVRTGFAAPRPSFLWKPLKWLDLRAQILWTTGVCQGMAFCDSPDGEALVFAFDGKILFLDLASMEVRHLTVETRDENEAQFNSRLPFIYFCQRGRYMVVQDGTSRPLILDGRRAFYQSLTSAKVPTGTMMADGWGRMALVSHDRRRIYFSNHELDPLGPLAFTEGTSYFLNARYFEVPRHMGRIVALHFSPSLNGSKRFGPLVAMCERGTMAYDVSIPRSSWLTQDIASMVLPSLGACSHMAVTSRGANLLFSDHNGRIQSMAGAVAEQQDNTLEPIDSNIWPLCRGTTDLAYRSAVTFDDRTLTTVHPQRVKRADGRLQIRHRALAVLQHDPAVPISPVWDGLWTGIHPVFMATGSVKGSPRCFALSLDDDGKHRLYEVGTKTDSGDLTESGREAVSMMASLKATDLELPFATKSFQGAAARLSGVRGSVKVRAWWEQDRKPAKHWFTHTETGPSCMALGCSMIDSTPSNRIRLSLPSPGVDFYEAGMTFQITGQATLEEVALDSIDGKASSKTSDVVCAAKEDDCPPNPFLHSI